MQLLVSVKNADEALLALASGTDIIDLKDPGFGAMGALDITTSSAIISALNSHELGQAVVSAAVGEAHASLNELVADMQERTDLGAHFLKVVVSELFYAANFLATMSKLTKTGIKVVAVFFADERVDFTLLPILKRAGFYGAMLDTKNKRNHLLQIQTKDDLHLFTHFCHQHHLKSGLAGSLQTQHIGLLAEFNATYIGFRGGVCENHERTSDLSSTKILEAKSLLLTHNKFDA